jgi:biotin carboxyl carrier protein
MKMENAIVAPKDAKVVAVHVTKGQSVESGAALVSLG